jgi:hypothetical protein
MNSELYRLHRVLFIAYMSFIALFALIGVFALVRSGDMSGIDSVLIGLVVVPISVFHYYAAKGVRDGKAWGRTLTKIFAGLLLIGFPIGTLIGIYIFKKTGEQWQGENSKEVKLVTHSPAFDSRSLFSTNEDKPKAPNS